MWPNQFCKYLFCYWTQWNPKIKELFGLFFVLRKAVFAAATGMQFSISDCREYKWPTAQPQLLPCEIHHNRWAEATLPKGFSQPMSEHTKNTKMGHKGFRLEDSSTALPSSPGSAQEPKIPPSTLLPSLLYLASVCSDLGISLPTPPALSRPSSRPFLWCHAY